MSHWLLGQLWTQELSVNVLASTINNIPEPTTTLLQTTDNRNIQRHFLGSECSDAAKLLLSVCEQKLTFTIYLSAARCKYGVRCNEERGISSQELIAACTAILISWIKICYFAPQCPRPPPSPLHPLNIAETLVSPHNITRVSQSQVYLTVSGIW